MGGLKDKEQAAETKSKVIAATQAAEHKGKSYATEVELQESKAQDTQKKEKKTKQLAAKVAASEAAAEVEKLVVEQGNEKLKKTEINEASSKKLSNEKELW